MSISVKQDGDKTILTPGNDIISSNTEDLKTNISTLVEDGVKELNFDLKNVEVVDSSGLSVLIAAQNSLKKVGGNLNLVNVSENIAKLFRMMRLDKHFGITER